LSYTTTFGEGEENLFSEVLQGQYTPDAYRTTGTEHSGEGRGSVPKNKTGTVLYTADGYLTDGGQKNTGEG
jgi:hypothetical protein